MAKYPLVRKIDDNKDSLDEFEKKLKDSSSKGREIILEFPVVYIHAWPRANTFAVYVGEANNIIQRTVQHYSPSGNQEKWEKELSSHKDTAELYIIGHEHFNKSMTLDLENRLILYLSSVAPVNMLNKRSNPQGRYFPSPEFDELFHKIWRKLHTDNPNIFPTESTVKKSALFKASPLHKLTTKQEEIKLSIIKKIFSALQKKKGHKLIFVDGEAGTGKTVLNSSIFYELHVLAERKDIQPKYHMIVNHKEQLNVYNQIAAKLGLQSRLNEIVWKPTKFINSHDPNNPVDVAFVDEAHLLLTQKALGYYGSNGNQLQDIIDRARVTVIMFDENQILTTEQYWEAQILASYKKFAQKNSTYFELTEQLRINASKQVLEWIDSFSKDLLVKKLPPNHGSYEIKAFKDISSMEKAIRKKARATKTKLSRLIATYDWEYKNDASPKNSMFWEVVIGNWHKPWNYQLKSPNKANQKKDLAWAEQAETINEVGSTFTIQGFDLNYAGVILGPSIKYQNGKIVIDPSAHHYKKATNQRTLSDGTKKSFGKILIKHEIRILMTRGINGLYIYACDDALREKLLESIDS